MKRSHGKTAWRFSSFSSKSVLSYVEFYLETFLVCEFCLICMLLGSFGESLGDVATYVAHSHTHTHLTALFPGLPRWAGTRKVKPIWILLNHETVSGIGISWAMCKSAPRSRQITTPAPHHSHTHTHTCLTALCPGLPWWAGTRKVKPIWILLKQETVSGSGIRWAICKSAPHSRQITSPAPHHSVFTGRMPFLPPTCIQKITCFIFPHNNRSIFANVSVVESVCENFFDILWRTCHVQFSKLPIVLFSALTLLVKRMYVCMYL